MDLFRSCITQELYNTLAGRTSDNGIVYQYDPFSIYYFPDRTQLNPDLIKTFVLLRRNERSADIFVFYQSDPVRNSGFPRVSQRRIQSAVGNTDHNIRSLRITLRQ